MQIKSPDIETWETVRIEDRQADRKTNVTRQTKTDRETYRRMNRT